MKPKIRRTPHWGPLSPLMRRIMAVNVIALVTLVGGIFYLNQFQESLLEGRIETLETQTQIIAGALGESASTGPESQTINIIPAQQIIARLIGPTNKRARLFSVSGKLIADSRLMALGRDIYVVPLPDIDEKLSFKDKMISWTNGFLDRFSSQKKLPLYLEKSIQTASDFEELSYAFEGLTKNRVRALREGGKIITIAVPVQRFRRVLGVLLISEEVSDIDQLVQSERLNILKVFGISLGFTLLLSFFLSETIANPIKRLSFAADEVRQGIGRTDALKSFANRSDEIGDLSYSLDEMTTALYNRIDAIERFAADVAHEIKNPLTSIRSAVETLERIDDKDIQKKLLSIIADDTNRLDRLISDISEASRLDAELSRGTIDEVDLEKLTATLTNTYQVITTNSVQKIEFKAITKGPFLIGGIESRISQVIRNLIDNAISFIPVEGTVTILLSKKDNKVLLEVIDTGPGVNASVGNRIFDRFYTERSPEENFGNHSGLGLNISKQITEAHGGSITVKNMSESDKVIGAKFTLTFPAL
ncbi:MAG: stimulus-sensing domain-containing protein [Sphingomonadales bacterium]